MTTANWTAIEIAMPAGFDAATGSETLDILSGLLFGLGAQGTETRDREDPVVVVAAFPPDIEPIKLEKDVRQDMTDAKIAFGSIASRTYEPVDWANHWKIHFGPLDFGKIWVVPTWLEPPAAATRVLRIDPSSAFGTGLHATTAMCVRRIAELSPVDSILDFGTGSGILALAALMLGAKRALAVDEDEEALVIARENAEKNGLQDGIELARAVSRASTERFPLVVANVLANPLIELAPDIAHFVAPGGRLLLSGLIRNQVDDVAAAYEALGLARESVTFESEWARIDMTRAA